MPNNSYSSQHDYGTKRRKEVCNDNHNADNDGKNKNFKNNHLQTKAQGRKQTSKQAKQ